MSPVEVRVPNRFQDLTRKVGGKFGLRSQDGEKLDEDPPKVGVMRTAQSRATDTNAQFLDRVILVEERLIELVEVCGADRKSGIVLLYYDAVSLYTEARAGYDLHGRYSWRTWRQTRVKAA
jgi:hypothetical protein